MATLHETEAAQARAVEVLRGHPDVSAIGITRDEDGYALRISLEREDADLSRLMEEVDEVPVNVRYSGKVRALRS